jgi:Protein of unknown function (DUF3828)
MSSTAVKSARVCALLAFVSFCNGTALGAEQDMRAPVVAVYKNFAWQALADDEPLFGGGLADQPRATLSRFFEPRLAALLTSDAQCRRQRQEICRIDFDILFDAQDVRVADLSITAAGGNKVTVSFKDPVTGSETLIDYAVRRGAEGWRIDDIVYRQGERRSLRALLSATLGRK